jgi:uncharacterized membrane protein
MSAVIELVMRAMPVLFGVAAVAAGIVGRQWAGIVIGLGLVGLGLFLATKKVEPAARSKRSYLVVVAGCFVATVAAITWAAVNASDSPTRLVAIIVLFIVIVGGIIFAVSRRSPGKVDSV